MFDNFSTDKVLVLNLRTETGPHRDLFRTPEGLSRAVGGRAVLGLTPLYSLSVISGPSHCANPNTDYTTSKLLMSFSLTTVVASDAERLIRDCDFPAMQDHPIRLTMFPRSCPETQEEEIRWMANGFRNALEKDSSNYRKVCTDDGTPVGFAGWSLLNSSAARDDHSQGGQTGVHNPDPETLDMDTVSKVSKMLKEEQDRIINGRCDIWCKMVSFLFYNPCLLFSRPQCRCCESSVSASGYRLYANAMGL